MWGRTGHPDRIIQHVFQPRAQQQQVRGRIDTPQQDTTQQHNTTQHNSAGYMSVIFLAVARQRAGVGGGWHASLTSALPQHPIAGLSRTDLNASAQENNNKPNLQQGARPSVFDPALTACRALTNTTRPSAQARKRVPPPTQQTNIALLPPGKEGLILRD